MDLKNYLLLDSTSDKRATSTFQSIFSITDISEHSLFMAVKQGVVRTSSAE